jgi:GWxTD domain-containing protein
MKPTLRGALCLLALAMPAAAQHSTLPPPWSERPESVLLTDTETADLARSSAAARSARFERLFWARRDPDLETAVNEFRVDFEARVRAADAQFAEGELRGALTDRGKALVVLGVPAERQGQRIADYLAGLYRDRRPEDGVTRNRFIGGADEDLSRLRADRVLQPRTTGADLSEDTRSQVEGKSTDETLQHGVRFSFSGGMAEIWTYTADQLPPAARPADGKPVTLVFFDLHASGTFVLQSTIRDSERGIETLAAAAAASVSHPDLEEPPVSPLLAGSPRAEPRHLEWLQARPAPWPEGSMARTLHGVRSVDEHPLWVVLQLPADAPVADTMAGRLVSGDGVVVASFKMPVQGVTAAGGQVYEVAVPALEAGASLDIALGAGERPLAVRRLALEEDAPTSGATYITPMAAGAEFSVLESFEPGAPFVFGGYHLVPRLDGRYTTAENLNYFCLLSKPGVGEDGQPRVTVARSLYQEGVEAPLASSPAQAASLSAVSPGVFMVGSQLPLAKLPAGDYRFEVTVTDQVSGVTRETRLPFSVS